MRLALTGDVMLGRLVNDYVILNAGLPAQTIWGDVLPVLAEADVRYVNLECVISAHGRPWDPTTKAFHFRASPRAIAVLRAARIDCVSLANNHVLDFGREALGDCLRLLDRAGIRRAGAGVLADAVAPAVVPHAAGRVAVLAVTDNEPTWEAGNATLGINYIAYNGAGLVQPYRSRIATAIRAARRRADFVIISAHVGPNWGAPSRAMQALAHELLDAGADLYWGHSNHTPQGIEIYNGKAILYSTGDFVDDYAIDRGERNDLSFLFMVDLAGGRTVEVRLYPTAIQDCRVRRARRDEAAFLEASMTRKCAAFQSRLEFEADIGTLRIG